MPDDPQTEQSKFLAAIEKRDPAERAAFLDQACGDNAKLRAEVEALIRAHETSGGFLEKPVGQREITGESTPDPDVVDPARLASTLEDTQPTAEVPGTVIAGRYKLLQNLGEGGMGTVYMAEQQQPVKRRVALKIIKAGMDSAQVIARFEQERQALAMMDHPNIAKVLDAGTMDTGRPFVVMELVKGIPLTKFCDQEHLTPKERLELFIPVCQAVQHAHQKGIIHRDLKPSNVLIALYDGKPVPKVIDFGVAKATGQKLTERTMFTEVGAIVGTLEYMAPEQAELNNLDIDTRADIYSLGVILYELLTGSPPFTAKQLRSAAFTEMLRIIREVEPPKPSTKLSSSAELPSIAAHRKLEPKRLTKLVSGELDWIVMKCLEKDRGRRYETANALAFEVQRYLQDEPVLAGPPSAAYRLNKFVRRYRVPVLAAVSVLLALVGGIVGTSWGLVRAERERRAAQVAEGKEREQRQLAEQRRAEADAARQNEAAEGARAEEQHNRAEANFQKAMDAVDRMLTRVGEKRLAEVPQMDETRQRLLEDALEFHQHFLQEQSADSSVRRETARAYQRTGHIYKLLGKYEQAETQYQQALTLQKHLVGDVSHEPVYGHEMAASYQRLGDLLRDTGRSSDAEKAYREAIEVLGTIVDDHGANDEFRETLAASLNRRGLLYGNTGRVTEAKVELQRALRIRQELVSSDERNSHHQRALAESYASVAELHVSEGDLSAAEEGWKKVLEIRERLSKTDSGDPQQRYELAQCYQKLAKVYENRTELGYARAIYDKALLIFEKLADNHPRLPEYQRALAATYNSIAWIDNLRNQPAEAEARYNRTISILEKLAREYPQQVEFAIDYAGTFSLVAEALREQGDLAGSVVRFTQAVEALRRLLDREPQHTLAKKELAWRYYYRAETFVRMDRLTEAQEDWRSILELAEGERNADVRVTCAMALGHLGAHAGATAAVEEMLALGEEPAAALYNFACTYSVSSATVLEDEKLTIEERQARSSEYATRAVLFLTCARSERKINDLIQYIEKDKDLDPLRARDDFQTLLKELAAEQRTEDTDKR